VAIVRVVKTAVSFWRSAELGDIALVLPGGSLGSDDRPDAETKPAREFRLARLDDARLGGGRLALGMFERYVSGVGKAVPCIV
jgi:hypothetical protein